MKLTALKCNKAKPRTKPYKMADGGGLSLMINVNGTKTWLYRCRVGGKEKPYSIGIYPDVGLAEARVALARAKKLIKDGIDPTVERASQRLLSISEQKTTFRVISEDWIAKKRINWAASTAKQCETVFKTDIWPVIGKLPIKSITTLQLSQLVKKVEKRGAETIASLIVQWVTGVYKHAAQMGLVENNPAYLLQGSVTKPKTVHKKPLNSEQLALLGTKLGQYRGRPETVLALKIMTHTFVRTKELRLAKWSEFDLEECRWVVPAERMKKRESHMVPISRQTLVLIKGLKKLTGNSKSGYLFPNTKSRKGCMSATTINRALEYMGFSGSKLSRTKLESEADKETIGSDSFSGHCFRATASTFLNENKFRHDVIEMQLAHKERDRTRASYNQAQYWGERVEMMQCWSDHLEAINETYASIPEVLDRL